MESPTFKFSDRIGITNIPTNLIKDGLSIELRNSLWTAILELAIEANEGGSTYTYVYSEEYSERCEFYRTVWMFYLKLPIDTLTVHDGKVFEQTAKAKIRDYFFGAEWYLALNFVEFCAQLSDKEFQVVCNEFLKQEFSAYRFVEGRLIEINSKEEIIEIETAIKNSDQFKPVKTHLKTALELISEKKNPDFRNSIKESISAIESLCKIILKDEKTTLGAALRVIETTHKIPGSLKNAFSDLYGYTSDEGGIRHGLLENNIKIDVEEARFMLITCSAFINYLICKL